MAKYFVVYGNKTNLDFNLHVVTRPVKPSAEMQYGRLIFLVENLYIENCIIKI